MDSKWSVVTALDAGASPGAPTRRRRAAADPRPAYMRRYLALVRRR
jgi:hypothetical protein